jgi:anti-sigma B factor antagonist
VDISEKQIDQTLVVSVVGSIDAHTADQVLSFLRERVAGGQSRLVLDLGQVEFMSSAGLRVIVDILRRCREEGGDLCLASAHGGVENTLGISGFTRVLKTYPTVEMAVDSFGFE